MKNKKVKFIIATDGDAELDENALVKEGINVLPIARSHYSIEGKNGDITQYSVGSKSVDFSIHEGQIFYDTIGEDTGRARTHATNADEFREFFENIYRVVCIAEGVDCTAADAPIEVRIAYIGIGSGLSAATLNGAQAAADELMKNPLYANSLKIVVYDSMGSSFYHGAVVLHAAKMLAGHKGRLPSLETFLDKLDDWREKHLHILCIFGDLDHLRRGGRTTYLKAWVGGMLGVKPVGTYSKNKGEGVLVVGKTKFKGQKAAEYIKSAVLDSVEGNLCKVKGYGWAHSFGEGKRFAERSEFIKLKEEINEAREFYGGVEWKFENEIIGPISGTHVGPDSFYFVWETE